MHIQAVSFKRTEKSKWAKGIMINQDKLIIDKNSKPVPGPVWDFRYSHEVLSVEVPWVEEPNIPNRN